MASTKTTQSGNRSIANRRRKCVPAFCMFLQVLPARRACMLGRDSSQLEQLSAPLGARWSSQQLVEAVEGGQPVLADDDAVHPQSLGGGHVGRMVVEEH